MGFRKFNLTISEKKTHKTDVDLKPQDGKHKRRAIKFLGFVVHKEKTRSGKGTKMVFRTEPNRFTKAKANIKTYLANVQHTPISHQARVLNWLLRGRFNYFGLPGNSTKIAEIADFARIIWRRSFSRRSQNGKQSWMVIRAITSEAKIVQPRLKITYKTLNNYVVL